MPARYPADTWRFMLRRDRGKRSWNWRKKPARPSRADETGTAATWHDHASTVEMERRKIVPIRRKGAAYLRWGPPVTSSRRSTGPAPRRSSRRWCRYVGGRPASSDENGTSTDAAEERVERQARAFELLKPYLVERGEAAAETDPR